MFANFIKDACKNSKNCTAKCTCFLLPFNLHQQTAQTLMNTQSLITTQSLHSLQKSIKTKQLNNVAHSGPKIHNKDLKIRPFYM